MRVTWIGLGHMGLPMASNLARRANDVGDELVVYDVDEGARAAASAEGLTVAGDSVAAVNSAEVVFTMLPNGEIVTEVLMHLFADLDPDTVVVDCSTIASADVAALHGAARGHGIRFVDAPVSGGTAGAAAGTLTFMVGGAVEDLERVAPLLGAMGARTFHAGEVGRGQDAKVVNNLMLAINMQSVVEAARLADRLGLEHRTLVDIATQSSGDSWVLRAYYPVADVVDSSPAGRNFEGGFATALMLKDLRLALAAAASHGLAMPAASLVETRLQELVDLGAAHRDFSILVRDTDELGMAGAR